MYDSNPKPGLCVIFLFCDLIMDEAAYLFSIAKSRILSYVCVGGCITPLPPMLGNVPPQVLDLALAEIPRKGRDGY